MNVLKWLDCGLNVLIGGLVTLFVKHYVSSLGSFKYTCSQTWAMMRDQAAAGQPLWMYSEACVACKILTRIQNVVFRIKGDHCSESLQ